MQSELLQHDETSLQIKLTSCQCKPPPCVQTVWISPLEPGLLQNSKDYIVRYKDLCKQQHPLDKGTLEWQYTEGEVEPQPCKQFCMCPPNHIQAEVLQALEAFIIH